MRSHPTGKPRYCLVLGALLSLSISSATADEKAGQEPVQRWTKHVFMITGRPDLKWPVTEVSERSHYACAKPIQLTATKAALFCQIKQVGIPVIDLCGGVDLIMFDSLKSLSEKNAIPLARNHYATHPRNGAPLVMVKYPVSGGFVPLGAKLRDGSAHPAAGTGFGLLVSLGFPRDHSDLWAAARKDIHSILQLQQYRYDGAKFEIVSDKILDRRDLMADCHISNVSMDNALPDGRDFLMGLVGRQSSEHPSPGCIMSRWRYLDREWRPVSAAYVTGSEKSFEPSTVRAKDGSLLLSARRGTEFNVWRSTDAGATWTQVIKLDKMRASSPVTIHRTLGGSPFLCANPYTGPYKNGIGREVRSGRWRETVAFWPLTDDREGVQKPSFAFDFNRARFGPSPNGSAVWADHPISGIVRLADGKLHCILSLRVWSRNEMSNEVLATPMSGTWVKEVLNLNDGPPIPVWKF